MQEGELKVMGGTPDAYPDRYAKVSPAQRLPFGIPQILIWGERDSIVPESVFRDYEKQADQVEIIRVPGVGHFDFTAAEGPAWQATLGAVSRLMKLSTR